MKVLLHCDASYHKENGTAAWALIIEKRKGRFLNFRHSGHFLQQPASSQYAELYAALIGISCAITFGAKEILVCTDHLDTVRAINYDVPNHPFTMHLQRSLTKIYIPVGTHITAKHVPAHTDKQDLFSKRNRWCDQEAKRARNELEQ